MSEIVVVGAGPTGLTLACQLLRRGIPCRVVDREPHTTRRSRAIGVSPRSLEVLDELGAAEELIDRGVPAPIGTFFSRGRRIGRVTFSGVEHARYPFMLAVPQSETEAVLEHTLERLGGSVERELALRELSPSRDRVSLVLDGPGGEEAAEASWVVGADGAHSAVRKLSGIGFEGQATGDVFASVDARVSDGPPLGEGYYNLTPEGMLVIVPLGENLCRITASLGPDEHEAEFDLGYIQALADRRGDGRLKVLELHDAGWGIAKVRIQARVAGRFRSGRCLLAGDAAHIYGPTGAQGMNGGIQDAHALAWRLALVSEGRAGEELIDEYEPERRPVARAVLRAVNAQTRMATVKSGPAVAVRDAVVRLATRTGVLDRRLAPEIGQLEVSYRRSPGVAASGRPGPARRGIGRRIPDVATGAGATLYDLLREQPFTVLVLGAGPPEAAQASALGKRIEEGHGDLAGLHLVRSEALDEELRVSEPTALLVRPDGHVAWRGPLAEPAPLLDHLNRILGTPRVLEHAS